MYMYVQRASWHTLVAQCVGPGLLLQCHASVRDAMHNCYAYFAQKLRTVFT